MLNNNLLDTEIQDFITKNINSDLTSLRLKKSPFEGVTSLELIQQIQGKKIARTKLSFLYDNTEIIYPSHLNLEQASSEATARFKQSLISGKKGIDLTGGTGIDSFFISENTDEYFFIEPNLSLLEIVKQNFTVFRKDNVSYFNITAENFLEDNNQSFDFIYLDPSRRDKNKNKKFLLEDLIPNVTSLQSQLLSFSKNVFIKLSPLFDLQQAIQQLQVSDVYIVSLKNEVKELLLKLDQKNNENPLIHCVNLETDQPYFCFYWLDEKNADIPIYSKTGSYIFMPNAAVLKSGAFKLIALKYGLQKLNPNTHLYTSEEIIKDFPGRIFRVIDPEFSPVKKEKYNIISRNYPLKTDEIKKKYKLTEGGENYLFFTKDISKNVCILATLTY